MNDELQAGKALVPAITGDVDSNEGDRLIASKDQVALQTSLDAM